MAEGRIYLASGGFGLSLEGYGCATGREAPLAQSQTAQR